MTPRSDTLGKKLLLASIHDASPKFLAEIELLYDRLGRALGSAPALLVVPDHWSQAPIAHDMDFQRRLRAWAARGSELFVHGWTHRDDAAHASLISNIRAKTMTAGEGEFLGLDRIEALRRMQDGKRLIEDIVGAPVAGFIAPAWLYGQGAHAALAHAGFEIAEDHMKVWNPVTGAVLARGPVITWASRTPLRLAASVLFAGLARRALVFDDVVRIAVHPGDAHEADLLKSIDTTLATFVRRRAIGRYSDLSSGSRGAAAPSLQ